MRNAGTEQQAITEAYLHQVESAREFCGTPDVLTCTCICCIMIRVHVCERYIHFALGYDKYILGHMTISSRRVYGCRDCKGHARIHSHDGGNRG